MPRGWAVTTAVLVLIPPFARAQHDLPGPPEQEAARDEAPPPPKFLLKGFGDVSFERREQEGPDGFVLGELDLFVTSELSDALSFLAEIVFEGDEEGGEPRADPVVDIERYEIRYSRSDLLNVALGRMHTHLGFWNQNYHHGKWFQTTAFRPVMYLFEDEGGVLPVHELGVQLFGTKAFSGLLTEYSLSVTNGRAAKADEVQNFGDANGAKAVNLWLGVGHKGRPGLSLGGVARYDTIPADPGTPGREDELKEGIVGAFFVYQRARAELLSEVVRVTHEDVAGKRFRTLGLYAQAGVQLTRFKPYYRFDLLDIGERDPYYTAQTGDLTKHTLGVRVDPWLWACLKLEASHDQPDPGAGHWGVAGQVAFTF